MTIEIRPLAGEDWNAMVELAGAALGPERISEARLARYLLLDPSFDASGAMVAKAGNILAGFVFATARKPPADATDAQRGFITALAVDERFRRQGLGTRLVAAAEASLKSRGKNVCLVSPYGPSYLAPGVDVAAYPAAIAMFEKLGYEQISRPISMQVDLSQLREIDYIARKRREFDASGAKVEPYTPAMTRLILDFARAEFGIDWHDAYRDTMLLINRGLAPAERILVAHCGGEVLGISHWDGERFGPIGVSSRHRSRGIGQILMFDTLARQRAAGHSVAWFLWSDDNTARRLYDNAGFREVRRFVVFRKSLA
jgi:ribosomal protein S18 acetylase RimI-like enzyme